LRPVYKSSSRFENPYVGWLREGRGMRTMQNMI
jgi:hypothetical protein